MKISSENKFILKSSTKSSAFCSGLLNRFRTFCIHWSRPLSEEDSLYFQCAAKPFSAISFIRLVRICTSTHWPRGPITVVCKDSYPLPFGVETQSRKRSGFGRYRSVIIEYTFQHSVFSFSYSVSIMTRMANKSYTSSNGIDFLRILFQIE